MADTNFIIAVQKPNKEYFKTLLSDELRARISIYSGFLRDSIYLKHHDTGDSMIINEYMGVERFIQQDSCFYKQFKDRISDQNTPQDIVESQIIIDSVLKNNMKYKAIFRNKLNYWIISVHPDTLYGPYLKNEYLKQRAKINIPEKLELGSIMGD